MDFKAASEELTRAITLADIAHEAGVSEDLIRKARIADEGSSSYRRPPAGWQEAVARLALRRASELEVLAEELKD